MIFTCEIVINKPVNEVVALFDNPDHLHKWMQGLQKFEPLSGVPGQVGARSRLTFQFGKRKMEMIETVEVRNLPFEFTGLYTIGKGSNRVKNSFLPVNEYQTKFCSENTFEFRGLMKLMALLMPGAFKKQSMKYLVDFKNFAESTNP
jgi:Polyketide cyclase / dehydrase and lipid transport